MPATSQRTGERPLHAPSHETPPQVIVTPEPVVTAWVGWIWFGVAIMAMVGIFDIIAGIVAILDDNFLVGAAGKFMSSTRRRGDGRRSPPACSCSARPAP
ncbi:MAG: hypothetical protein JO265_01880 [Acidimicrobiia bacterium]|nr:hypothetical protein [Acidimicrobiia bacterium]